MRARDLMEDFPLVGKHTDALAATRLLVERGLPGLVVLPGSQVLRFALPEYVEDDPTLAAVFLKWRPIDSVRSWRDTPWPS